MLITFIIIYELDVKKSQICFAFSVILLWFAFRNVVCLRHLVVSVLAFYHTYLFCILVSFSRSSLVSSLFHSFTCLVLPFGIFLNIHIFSLYFAVYGIYFWRILFISTFLFWCSFFHLFCILLTFGIVLTFIRFFTLILHLFKHLIWYLSWYLFSNIAFWYLLSVFNLYLIYILIDLIITLVLSLLLFILSIEVSHFPV